MLRSMRRHSQSFVIYLLFGILIIVFVFMFGLPSTDSCNPQTRMVVASAGGFEIDSDFLRSSTLRAFGDTFRGGDEEFFATQQRVLANLLAVLLVAEKAHEAGMRVSDDELRQYIMDVDRGNPDTMRYTNEGVFDRKSYKTFLDYYGLTPELYERYKRHELLARNYLSMLEYTLVVSESELRDAYSSRAEQVNLNLVRLAPGHVSHLIAAPTPAEVTAFLANEMSAVRDYYEANSREFKVPTRVHLQEIIVQKRDDMLREVGSATDREMAAADRFALVQRRVIDEGLDFAEAAGLYNEALVHRENGGDRGWADLDNLSKAHRDALAGKVAGDVVAFETELTYNVVRLVEEMAGSETSLDQAQLGIAETLLKASRVNDAMDQAAKAIYDKTKGGLTLEQAIQEVLYANVLAEAPAAAVPTVDEGEGEGEGEGDVVVPVVVPTQPVIPLEARLQVEESGPFSARNAFSGSWAFVPRLGNAPSVARAALTLENAGQLTDEVHVVDDARVIVQLKERVQGTDEEFAEQRNDLVLGLQMMKSLMLLGNWRAVLNLQHPDPREQAFGPWLQALYEQAEQSGKFKINKDFLRAGAMQRR